MEPELEVLATRMSQNGSSLFNQMQRYLTSTAEMNLEVNCYHYQKLEI